MDDHFISLTTTQIVLTWLFTKDTEFYKASKMKAYTNEQFRSLLKVKGFPIVGDSTQVLYRGCHVAELGATVELANIQGRPEDKSFNGNILHLNTFCRIAYSYAQDNKRREQFSDKRVCVVAYDKNLLGKCGRYELKKENELRWHCNADVKYMSQIRHCILFILYEGKCYTSPEQIPNDVANKVTDSIAANYVLYNRQTNTKTLISLEKNRIKKYESQLCFDPPKLPLVFDSKQHAFLQLGEYVYEPKGDFALYKTTEQGFSWEMDCNLFQLANLLLYLEENACHSLVELTYPVRMTG